MTESRAVQNKLGYRKDIDGLRAIAIIIVIINHLNHAVLPGGYLGVDVFFVISGYVITTSLENRAPASLGTQLLSFYARRIKRLMPALLVMVFATITVLRLFADTTISTVTGITSLFGLSNIFLFSQSTNYFGASALRDGFSHTWSLGVEEQFYLLYPLLILWRTTRSKNAAQNDRLRVSLLAALSALSLLLFAVMYRINQPAAYFLAPFRFWELGLGCLMALMTRASENRGSGQPLKINGVIPLLAMTPAMFLADHYPVACTAIVALATTALIGSIRSGTIAYAALSSRFATRTGKISYSLYLWHWAVICISYWTIGIHLWSLPFQIGAMLILSIASYHFIENPLRERPWIGGRYGPILIGTPLMIAVAGLIFLGQKYAIPSFSGDPSAELAFDSPVPGYVTKYSKRNLSDCFAEKIFQKTDGSIQEKLDHCTAKAASSLTLIFVGDSHATDLIPMADLLYKDDVASVVNISQPGCRFPPLQGEGRTCDYTDSILKMASANQNGTKILVIRNNYSPRVIDGDLGDFSKRLESLLSRTAAAGLKIVYVAPAPKYYSLGAESLCNRQWYRPDWAIAADCRNGFPEDRNEELARRQDVTKYLLGLSRKRTDFLVFDPFEPLCGSSGNSCTPVRDGRLIYRDDNHLTAQGSELLAAPFTAFLRNRQLIGATTATKAAARGTEP